MVEALRAALRLLSSVRPIQPAYSSASFVRRRALGDHSGNVVALGFQQQACNFDQRQRVATAGLSRLARAVLAYVGTGLSTIAATLLSGSFTVHAKKLQSTSNYSMAGAEARVIWQRAATKRCFLHEDAKRSQKLSQLPCDFSDYQSDKTYLGSPKTAEEKDLFTSIDSWTSLDSQCSHGKKSNRHFELNSNVHKDYRSSLDESFMFRFSKSDEFDSLKAADVSLGSFADLQLLISGEVGSPELGYKQRLIPDQQLETDNSSSLSLEPKVVGEYNESNQTSKENIKHESEIGNTIGFEGKFEPSSFPEGEHGLVTRATAISFEGSKRLQKVVPVPKLQSKDKVSWRTADTEELAALVARKSLEHLENCDLPPSQSLLVQKGVLEGCDLNSSKRHRWDMSRSMDRDFLISLLRGHEPVRLETRKPSFSEFVGPSDPLPLPHHVPQSPRSLPVVSEKITPFINQTGQVLSLEPRVSSWSAGSENIQEGDRGPQLLGEALCHSQTRAREAEKAAAQALLEKERVTRLFFQEASISLTYRQWVDALQAENMRLRLRVGDRSSGRLKKNLTKSFATFEPLSNTHWRHSRKERTRKEMQHHCNGAKDFKELKHRRGSTRSDAMAGYTLGLAFAFGLSLAGAGLVLGWSMGWILFAPLGN